MSSTLLLLQFASQNIALFCCALFTGAATYVSLVEHPAMDEGGAKLAGAYLLTTHPRPVIVQASFGVVGSLAGIVAGLAGGGLWWSAGGIVLAGAMLFQLSVVMRVTRGLLDFDPRGDPEAARRLFAKLAKLHAVLSLAGLTSLFMFITKA